MKRPRGYRKVSTMTTKEAESVLGLATGTYSQADIEAAYSTLHSEVAQRIAAAPTSSLRTLYAGQSKALEEARNVLLLAAAGGAGDLSASQVRALPIEQPSYTGTGSGESGTLDSSIALSIGGVLAGRYEVRGLLGSGGMGAVYCVWDSTKSQEAAIKVLLPRLIHKEGARQRFLNEAKIAASLSHPGIVNVFDIQNEGNLFFITMEKLEGKPLRQHILDRKTLNEPFSIKEVQRIGRELCEALHYAHQSASTVHRDVKPENVWICPNGSAKILDFGIAAILKPDQQSRLATGSGTYDYMSPEQRGGHEKVGPASDQYSVAVLLYELITGRTPGARSASARKQRKGVPTSLSRAIDKALEDNPSARFAGIAEFGRALSKGWRQSGVSVRLPSTLSLGPIFLGAIVVAFLLGTGYFLTPHLREPVGQWWAKVMRDTKADRREAIELQGATAAFDTQLSNRKTNLDIRQKELANQVAQYRRETRSARDNQNMSETEDLLAKAERELGLVQRLSKRLSGKVFSGETRIAAARKCRLGEEMLKSSDYYDARKAFEEAEVQLRGLLEFARSYQDATDLLIRSPELDRPPIHVAVETGDEVVVAALIDLGQDPNETSLGTFPLFVAFEGHHWEAAAVLVEHRAAIQETDSDGRTPLHHVAGGGPVSLAELLLKNGAEVNATTHSDHTPLDMTRDIEMHEFLVAKGAKPGAFFLQAAAMDEAQRVDSEWDKLAEAGGLGDNQAVAKAREAIEEGRRVADAEKYENAQAVFEGASQGFRALIEQGKDLVAQHKQLQDKQRWLAEASEAGGLGSNEAVTKAREAIEEGGRLAETGDYENAQSVFEDASQEFSALIAQVQKVREKCGQAQDLQRRLETLGGAVEAAETGNEAAEAARDTPRALAKHTFLEAKDAGKKGDYITAADAYERTASHLLVAVRNHVATARKQAETAKAKAATELVRQHANKELETADRLFAKAAQATEPSEEKRFYEQASQKYAEAQRLAAERLAKLESDREEARRKREAEARKRLQQYESDYNTRRL